MRKKSLLIALLFLSLVISNVYTISSQQTLITIIDKPIEKITTKHIEDTFQLNYTLNIQNSNQTHIFLSIDSPCFNITKIRAESGPQNISGQFESTKYPNYTLVSSNNIGKINEIITLNITVLPLDLNLDIIPWNLTVIALPDPPKPPTTIEETGNNTLEIIHGLQYELASGWNLISIPLIIQNNSISNVFNNSVTVRAWNGEAYAEPETIDPGVGYWVKTESTEKIIIKGDPINTITHELEPGYNIIGGPYADYNLSQIPEWNVVAKWESGAYTSSEIIKPKQGYFILVMESITLEMP